MNLIISLFSGFISAFIGITPPGLLNMTAAKVSLKEGRRNAFWFVSGAVVVIFIQVYLAVLFARIINARPDIILLLREVGFGIFGSLTVYFLWIAKQPKIKQPKIKKQSKKKRFFLGMLLSALNFFPIPYYVFVSVSLYSYTVFSFDVTSVFTFVSGAVLGSVLVFYFYIAFFQKIEKKADYLLRNMNKIIGGITGLVAVITLVNILEHYLK
jgi:threonine/homoserine/homoserine lactone efflux protein